jgi:hypothetical protein
MSRVRSDGLKGLLGSGIMIAIVTAIMIGGNTDPAAPPRFDGAGYAVLGEALATGRGYREIDHPDQPRHAHYPPGYPAALALLWRAVGRSIEAAHALSFVCTLGATLAAWAWYRTLYPPRVAWLLALALATNWTWARIGGAIQSEPPFLLLEMLAVLVESWAGRGDGAAAAAFRRGLVLGLLLGACVLTRHVAACLALALVFDLWWRRRRAAAVSAGLLATAMVLPWAGWLATVGHHTQPALLAQGGLAHRLAGQGLFYLQRIPDQLTGPAVEIGTVFRHSRPAAAAANAWAVLASGLVIVGWLRTLRDPRRRVAGLVPLATLPLLLAWPFTEAGRFLIPLVPFLLVGAVEALAVLAARFLPGRPRAWAAGILLALSLPYSIYAIVSDRAGAQRKTYRDFDAACAWIVAQGERHPGPLLTRHPGEAYWLTGRPALAPSSDDPEATDRTIDRYHAAFLLIDEERYARAPANPLSHYVTRHPERVRLVWQRETGGASVAVYEVVRGSPPILPRTGPG